MCKGQFVLRLGEQRQEVKFTSGSVNHNRGGCLLNTEHRLEPGFHLRLSSVFSLGPTGFVTSRCARVWAWRGRVVVSGAVGPLGCE